jgi:hypothetical protein
MASVIDSSGVSDNINGTQPVIPSPTQKSTTTTKPSRKRNSSRTCLTGNHKASPIERISAKADINGTVVPSELKREIARGGNIVRLNKDSKIPNMRWMTASCMVILSLNYEL